MFKVSPLHGFNASKLPSNGSFWGFGETVRTLIITEPAYASLMEYAYAEWGESVYNDAATYIFTIQADHYNVTWTDGSNSWAEGSTFTLINEARISGLGGTGGGGGYADPGEAASNGGDALSLEGYIVSIDNSAGEIFGGGGGGGGGGGATATSTFVSGGIYIVQSVGTGGGGGGGGQGYSPFGSGGTGDNTLLQMTGGQQISTVGTITDTNVSATITSLSTDGEDGDETTAGVGGVGAIASGSAGGNALSVTGGDGGDGGGWGEDGTDGTDGTASGNTAAEGFIGSVAGLGGKAISLGGGSVTWIAGNDPSRVKGDVS